MEYTKGEWKVTGTSVFVNTDYRKVIAQVFDPDKPLHTTPIAEANAHLIAASPRMIEFIQQLVNNGNQEARDFIQTLDL